MRFFFCCAFVVTTTGCEILATNPLDPGTDPEFQQRATITGNVRAVRAPDGDGTVPAPGPCAADEAVDSSGFIVVLRGLAETGAGVDGETQATNASGAFEFRDVPAGSYVVEVQGAGFATPAPLELTVALGEKRPLGTLCAVRNVPPAPPLVEGPPALVDVDNESPGTDLAATLRIVGEAGVSYFLRETPDGGEPTRDEPVTDTTLPIALVLDPTPGVADDDVRRAWRVEVEAEDALGNRSAPTSFLVVKDGLAPLPPSFSFTAARDRVTVDVDAADVREDAGVVVDDVASSFFVAYAVVAPEDRDGPCPFGAPGDEDPVVHGRFAVEGASPLVLASDVVTLSGLQPGTELVLLAAGVDAAGNASCWSTPQLARPDVVTLAPSSSIAVDPVGGALRSSQADGAFAFARGDAGLVVVDRTGVSDSVVDAPAFDVAFHGQQLLVASGVLGLRVIPLDDDGVPGTAQTIGLGGRDARAVVGRLGRALVGGPQGLTSVPLDGTAPQNIALAGDADGAIVALASWGASLVVARDGDQPAVETYQGTTRVARAPLPLAPAHMIVVDGRAWVTQAQLGVSVVNVNDDDVLATRRLAGSRDAVQLAAYDDAVLVGDEAGDVTVASIANASISFIGRASVGERIDGVFARPAQVCVGHDGAAGSAFSCFSSVQGPLVDEERRFVPGGAIARVQFDSGVVLAWAGDTSVAHSLSRVSFPFSGDGNMITATVPGVGFLVGDTLGMHDGAVIDDVGIVDALEGEGLDAPFVGFGVVNGDRVALAVVAQGGAEAAAVVLTGVLVENGADVGLAQIVVQDLPAGVDQITTAVQRRGRAYFGSAPFGLFSVGLDGGAVVNELPLEADGELNDVAFVQGAEDGVVVAGALFVEGAPRERLFPLVGGVLDPNGGLAFDDGQLIGMTAWGSLLVVSTVDDGAVFVDVNGLRPVLQVPSVSQVGQTIPTARGLLCADLAGGAAHLVVR